MSKFKYMKRVSNGEVDWLAKVPQDTNYKDDCVTEITEDEYILLLTRYDDLDDPLMG